MRKADRVNAALDGALFVVGAAGFVVSEVSALLGIDGADAVPWIAVMLSARALARADAIWARFMRPAHMREG